MTYNFIKRLNPNGLAVYEYVAKSDHVGNKE